MGALLSFVLIYIKAMTTPISHYLRSGIKGALRRQDGVLKKVLSPECAYAVAKYLRRDKPQPDFKFKYADLTETW
ncbi:MAG: hypothetical protein B6247_27255 [Candidatus Parabeggiatoa sp. nov. 2]|nr:MAG: hypothetical protein B6247_27255 [Beggiatoa sp. 4572_84]